METERLQTIEELLRRILVMAERMNRHIDYVESFMKPCFGLLR